MSSGFISENEIVERRRVRQEEWEKVRQPNQPLEAPEDEYDPRSLFEKLEEQKKKKELEYEETHKLKNMIKGLDDDEVEFLDLVDRSKLEEEKKKSEEERREIADFRNKVASLQENNLEQRIQHEIRQPLKLNVNLTSGRTSQTKLLAGAIKTKRPADFKHDVKDNLKRPRSEPEEKIFKTEEKNNKTEEKNNKTEEKNNKTEEKNYKEINSEVKNVSVDNNNQTKSGSLTCIGILPGVGNYDISSDESDCSTDIEDDQARYDLLGRRIKKKSKNGSDSDSDSSSNENHGLIIENFSSNDEN